MQATGKITTEAYARQPKVLSAMGIEIRILSEHLPDDSATILEYTAPANFRGPAEHFHAESIEWFYLLDGALCLSVEGQEFTAAARDYLQVPRRALHRWWNPFPEPARMLVGFDRPRMHGYFEDLFALIASAPNWPPDDMIMVEELASRYDTFSRAALKR